MLSHNLTMILISATLLALSLVQFSHSLSTRSSPFDYTSEDNFATPHDVYSSISRALIDTRSDGLAGKLNGIIVAPEGHSLFIYVCWSIW